MINNIDKDLIEKNRIKGSLFGFFVGDALGVPVEFISRESLKNNKVNDMIEYGTHNQPKGTWSDDTSMVLATINSINGNKKIIYYDIMNSFVSWYKDGKYTPFNIVFDIGNATRDALDNYINNHVGFKSGSLEKYSNGNGSLMRILPISLFLCYKNMSMKDIIYDASSMTHGHIYSKLSCYIYTVYISELLKTNDKYSAYYNTQNIIQSEIDNDLELKETFNRLIYQDISKLSENDIKSTGYVIDTLEASLWCFLTTKNYKESVLKAINLGNDTDTIAAITGGLSGLFYGYDEIPIKWINELIKKEELNEYVEKFIEILMDSENNSLPKKEIVDKIINVLKNDPKACTLTKYGVSTISESLLGEDLSKFISYMHRNNMFDMNYLENYDKIKDKKIEEYTYEESITALTKIVRGDRFISGHIYDCFKDGSLLKVIEKIREFL